MKTTYNVAPKELVQELDPRRMKESLERLLTNPNGESPVVHTASPSVALQFRRLVSEESVSVGVEILVDAEITAEEPLFSFADAVAKSIDHAPSKDDTLSDAERETIGDLITTAIEIQSIAPVVTLLQGLLLGKEERWIERNDGTTIPTRFSYAMDLDQDGNPVDGSDLDEARPNPLDRQASQFFTTLDPEYDVADLPESELPSSHD